MGTKMKTKAGRCWGFHVRFTPRGRNNKFPNAGFIAQQFSEHVWPWDVRCHYPGLVHLARAMGTRVAQLTVREAESRSLMAETSGQEALAKEGLPSALPSILRWMNWVSQGQGANVKWHVLLPPSSAHPRAWPLEEIERKCRDQVGLAWPGQAPQNEGKQPLLRLSGATSSFPFPSPCRLISVLQGNNQQQIQTERNLLRPTRPW